MRLLPVVGALLIIVGIGMFSFALIPSSVQKVFKSDKEFERYVFGLINPGKEWKIEEVSRIVLSKQPAGIVYSVLKLPEITMGLDLVVSEVKFKCYWSRVGGNDSLRFSIYALTMDQQGELLKAPREPRLNEYEYLYTLAPSNLEFLSEVSYFGRPAKNYFLELTFPNKYILFAPLDMAYEEWWMQSWKVTQEGGYTVFYELIIKGFPMNVLIIRYLGIALIIAGIVMSVIKRRKSK